MRPNPQKRAVLVLRSAVWNDEETARTREALTTKLVTLGVAPEDIEEQEWREVNGHQTMAMLTQLLERARRGEIKFVAVRDHTRLGRFKTTAPSTRWSTVSLRLAGRW